MGMERSEILTTDLQKILNQLEIWIRQKYDNNLSVKGLTGDSLIQRNQSITVYEEVITLIDKIQSKGYYTQSEKDILNLLRDEWVSEIKLKNVRFSVNN
jgi:DNA-directed RNA polymerase specialized sigma54-like protein